MSITFVAVVRRRAELDFETFRQRWCEEHPPLVLAMPGVRGYRQLLAHGGGARDWPVDGIAQVTFDDAAAMRAAFASAEGATANRHQETFAGDVTWYLAGELVHEPTTGEGRS